MVVTFNTQRHDCLATITREHAPLSNMIIKKDPKGKKKLWGETLQKYKQMNSEVKFSILNFQF